MATASLAGMTAQVRLPPRGRPGPPLGLPGPPRFAAAACGQPLMLGELHFPAGVSKHDPVRGGRLLPDVKRTLICPRAAQGGPGGRARAVGAPRRGGRGPGAPHRCGPGAPGRCEGGPAPVRWLPACMNVDLVPIGGLAVTFTPQGRRAGWRESVRTGQCGSAPGGAASVPGGAGSLPGGAGSLPGGAGSLPGGNGGRADAVPVELDRLRW